MDTRFLETYLLVVDTGSIAAAARRLNVTSAAVAQRTRALEDEIGYPLIMRSGRTVSATEAGAGIVGESVSLLLNSVAEAFQETKRLLVNCNSERYQPP